MLDTVLVVKKDTPKEETTVKIVKEVYDDFKDLVESKGMEIKTTITKLVNYYTEREKIYQRYRFFLQRTAVEGNSIGIYDHKLNKNVHVIVSYLDDRHDNVIIRCDTCDDNEQCVHVAHVAESDALGEAHLNLKKSQRRSK